MTIDISIRSIRSNNGNDGNLVNKYLPNNVTDKEQLALLSILLTSDGVSYKYSIRPLYYSDLAILLIG
jgi:hypothetical protein